MKLALLAFVLALPTPIPHGEAAPVIYCANPKHLAEDRCAPHPRPCGWPDIKAMNTCAKPAAVPVKRRTDPVSRVRRFRSGR